MSSSRLKEEAEPAGSKGLFDVAQKETDKETDPMISHICIMIQANNADYRTKKKKKIHSFFMTTEREKLSLSTLLYCLHIPSAVTVILAY